ncbi:MAG: single-stranded DNA-binding protein [Bacteroidaceae bacterium]|nr:single-stranded DNA-binding protein [Bacteroidaceae bacterium]
MANNVIITGRLTKDPEYRKSESGVSFANFRVATSKKYGEIEKKLFIKCKAFRSNADFVNKFFHKGDGIEVAGQLWTEDWTSQDGSQRSEIVLEVSEASFPPSKKSQSEASRPVACIDGAVIPEGSILLTNEGLPF